MDRLAVVDVGVALAAEVGVLGVTAAIVCGGGVATVVDGIVSQTTTINTTIAAGNPNARTTNESVATTGVAAEVEVTMAAAAVAVEEVIRVEVTRVEVTVEVAVATAA